MKRLRATLVYVLASGCVSALAYLGWFQRIEWAGNLASFVLWVISLLGSVVGTLIVLGVAMYDNNKQKREWALTPISFPAPYRWVLRPLGLLQIGICVASGHWMLGFFLVWATFIIWVTCELRKEYAKLPEANQTKEG